LTQVPEPSTLTKPGPKAAQELALAVPFNGSNLSGRGFVGHGRPDRLGQRRARRQGQDQDGKKEGSHPAF